MSLQRGTAPRGISSTAPPAVAGTKRNVDGTVKNISSCLNIPDTDPDDESFKPDMVKKLVSNMRVYANNIAKEVENISRQPEKAYLLIRYEAQKMVLASQNMEGIMNAPTTVEKVAPNNVDPDTGLPSELSTQTQAAVRRIVGLEISKLREDLAEEAASIVMEDMDSTVAEAVNEAVYESWEYNRSDFLKEICEDIMDEDMIAVKESVMLELKARKVLGDMEDTQDQQRIMGVGDVIQ